jgi:biopolymer transport protein ExbB/TolQ
MIRLFIAGGPYMILLALLALVVLLLSAKNAIDLFAWRGRDPERLARGLDAILFWGCISAVLGFLGQFSGSYLSLMAIRKAGLVHPGMLAEGIAVSLLSTIFGLAILAVSALLWFGLRCRLNRVAARSAAAESD